MDEITDNGGVMPPEKIKNEFLIGSLFFSPTRNTRKVIKAISSSIKDIFYADGSLSGKYAVKTAELDITGIKNPLNTKMQLSIPIEEDRPEIAEIFGRKPDLLLVGTPVYVERIPPIAREFLKKIRMNDTPFIAITTFGNVSKGHAYSDIIEILRKNGGIPIALLIAVGEHSFNWENFISLGSNRPDEDDFKVIGEFSAKVAVKIREYLSGHLDDSQIALTEYPKPHKSLIGLIPEGISEWFGRNFLYPYPSKPDESKCLNLVKKDAENDGNSAGKCNVCYTSCPAGAISPEILDIDLKKCIRCMACVKLCPVSARSMIFRYKWLTKRFFKPFEDRRRAIHYYL